MKHTALAAILFGVVAASYAVFRYASGGPPDQANDPSAASLAVPLGFAMFLVLGGVVLWVVAGKGFTESKGSAVRRRSEGPVARVATGTKPD